MSERRGTVKLCSRSALSANHQLFRHSQLPPMRSQNLYPHKWTAQADSVSRTSAVWPQQRRGVIVVGKRTQTTTARWKSGVGGKEGRRVGSGKWEKDGK